ncbi:MAG: LON peptidase substrate-binding domain-containing protein, partial [Thermoanaerobaculia bacterium]
VNPDLYPIGCAGRIERCEPQSDGRYLIVLRGVGRFRIARELPLRRGYRQVEADYSDFPADAAEPAVLLDPSRMLHALRGFARVQGLEFDFDLLGSLPGVSLLNGLAAALPFRPAEKQALLEAAGPMEREELLLTLMGMGIEPLSADEYYSPPIVN